QMEKGVFSTTTAGKNKGKGIIPNPPHFSTPAAIVVDTNNGDIYVADGYGNRRVAVFDREGRFLRQWGRQATKEESETGAGGVFAGVVHCVTISNAGFVYVCGRQGDQVQRCGRMVTFIQNI